MEKGKSDQGIFQTPSGKWAVRYKDALGHDRIKSGFQDKTEAKKARKTLVGDTAAGRRTVPAACPSVANYCQTYLGTAIGRRPRDLRLHANTWTLELGKIRLDEVSPSHVRTIKAKWVREGRLTAASINRRLAFLRHLFNVASKDGYEVKNPVTPVGLLPENNQRSRVLALEEEDRLRDAFRPEYWHTVEVALLSTLRQEEQFTMRWEFVDFEAGTILIPHTKPHKRKWIYMNDRLREILWDLHQRRRGEWVFESPTGKRWVVRNFLARFWEPAVKQAGIQDLCWHDLRHTAASRMKADGVDLYTIKDVLGHSDIRTTQRYSHVDNRTLREAMNHLMRKPDAANGVTEPSVPGGGT